MSGLYSVFAVLAAMFALAGLEVFNYRLRQGTRRAREALEEAISVGDTRKPANGPERRSQVR